MATVATTAYRPQRDELFFRCLVASSIAGLVFLIAVMLAPVRKQVVTSIEQLPERFAKLIVDQPKPKPVSLPGGPGPQSKNPGGSGGGGSEEARPGPEPGPAAPPKPQVATPSLPAPPHAGAGTAGRERARAAVSSQLARTTRSLSSTLASLSSSLRATASSSGATSLPAGGRRARSVRSGRSESQLGSVRTDLPTGGSADLGGSAVQGSWVAIGSLSGTGGGGGSSTGGGHGNGSGTGTGDGIGSGSGGGWGAGSGGGYGTGTGSGVGSGSGGGSGPGVYRSNASLLAVIQKYSPGIQYCYSNELKRNPSLRGKMVVALVVSASGDVIDVTIVQNTVGSEGLAACARSQIKSWRFPAIPSGVTSFQVPFVFTPPE